MKHAYNYNIIFCMDNVLSTVILDNNTVVYLKHVNLNK